MGLFFFFAKETIVSAAWVALINATGLLTTIVPLYVSLPPYITGTTIALTWLFVLVALFGWLRTNAFYSPSIATSFFVAGMLSPLRLIVALLAEVLGALLGAHLLALFVNLYLGLPDLSVIGVPALNLAEASSWIDGALAEGLLMFFLCMSIYLTMRLGNFVSPIIVGLTAVALCLVGGRWTGPIMNPIAAFAPNYLTGQLDTTHFQVYWLGSMLGGVLAGLIFRLLPRPSPPKKAKQAQKSPKKQQQQQQPQQQQQQQKAKQHDQ